MATEIPENKVKPDAAKDGDVGIEDVNESHARPEETVLTGATREAFINKTIAKLKGENPDWADDKIKQVAEAAFNKANQDKASGTGNEENEEVVEPASDMTGA